jgi:hypothetical protein
MSAGLTWPIASSLLVAARPSRIRRMTGAPGTILQQLLRPEIKATGAVADESIDRHETILGMGSGRDVSR